MKLSEISRYWAAKELTTITMDKNTIKLNAPFASPNFTLKINAAIKNPPVKNNTSLQKVNSVGDLKSGSFYSGKTESLVCFDLNKGKNELIISG
jgi:hypothetical protein